MSLINIIEWGIKLSKDQKNDPKKLSSRKFKKRSACIIRINGKYFKWEHYKQGLINHKKSSNKYLILNTKN